MDQLVPFLGQWVWWVAAGVLLFLELMAPGVFFIWLGIAAALTGAIDYWFGLSWQGELLLFAALAVVSVFAGRRIVKSRREGDSDSPYLNQRPQGYVGQRYVLQEPIAGGRGHITIDDTMWEVQGPDAPKGAYVKVTGVTGMRLIVEPA